MEGTHSADTSSEITLFAWFRLDRSRHCQGNSSTGGICPGKMDPDLLVREKSDGLLRTFPKIDGRAWGRVTSPVVSRTTN